MFLVRHIAYCFKKINMTLVKHFACCFGINMFVVRNIADYFEINVVLVKALLIASRSTWFWYSKRHLGTG